MEADEFLLIELSAETKRDPILSPETTSNNQRLISSTEYQVLAKV